MKMWDKLLYQLGAVFSLRPLFLWPFSSARGHGPCALWLSAPALTSRRCRKSRRGIATRMHPRRGRFGTARNEPEYPPRRCGHKHPAPSCGISCGVCLPGNNPIRQIGWAPTTQPTRMRTAMFTWCRARGPTECVCPENSGN